jgi:RHH-type transcriptional regulator, rel operon repressor / antitoxin RelB
MTKEDSRMLAVRLPKEIEERLASMAAKTGKTKTFCVKVAILKHPEDLEDYYLAGERMARRGDVPGTGIQRADGGIWPAWTKHSPSSTRTHDLPLCPGEESFRGKRTLMIRIP